MKKYCVYLTLYRGNKLPPFYIGSSSVKRVEAGYRGSVASKQYKKIWEEELRQNSHQFKTIIISFHNTRCEASDKEIKFQKQLNVIRNDLYINKAYWHNGNIVYIPNKLTKAKWRAAKLGKKQSQDVIQRRLKSRKWYRHSEETKHKMSISAKGKPKSEAHKQALKGRTISRDHRDKISKANKGKPKSEEFKANLRGKKQSQETKNKRANSLSKIWIVTHPDGREETIKGMSQWCRSMNFDKPQYYARNLCLKGYWKGYSCKRG